MLAPFLIMIFDMCLFLPSFLMFPNQSKDGSFLTKWIENILWIRRG